MYKNAFKLNSYEILEVKVTCSCRSIFLKDFSFEFTEFHLNFICSLQTKGEEIFYIWFRSHDQDGAMPIYGKTFINFLLQNHWADCLETWHVCSILGSSSLNFI